MKSLVHANDLKGTIVHVHQFIDNVIIETDEQFCIIYSEDGYIESASEILPHVWDLNVFTFMTEEELKSMREGQQKRIEQEDWDRRMQIYNEVKEKLDGKTSG